MFPTALTTMKKTSPLKKCVRILRNTLIALFLLSITSVITFRYLPVPFTPLMIVNSTKHLLKGESPKFHHQWVNAEDIAPHLVGAVVAAEDQRFFEHHGFDFDQIQKAIDERIEGKRFRGGSTISQQTAKNVFTFCSSTWARKAVETYFTILIEIFWSKERILEVYLNSIEMGIDIYGAEALAQEHFNCSAKKLSKRECALIAATLPNPQVYSSKKPSKYMRKRQSQILKQMRNLGY